VFGKNVEALTAAEVV